jgi:Cytochrome c7 and related cytochrome c
MTTNFMSRLKITHRLIMAILMTLVMSLFAASVNAEVVHHKSDFNHMKTGFPLTGVHTNVECETCHAGGIFKGTPTNCAGCHSPGRNVIAPSKHANHFITNAPCESCHTNTVSFLGARFDHMGVQPRACMSCHNSGTFAPGKPAGHPLTVASCDSCHRTSAWIPAGYDHIGVVPGSCASCHNGSTAIGKPPFHIEPATVCDTCHTNFITFAGLSYNHSGANPLTCGNCHNGQSLAARQRPANHIPYSGIACGSCHVPGYPSFVGPGASAVVIHNTILPKPCKDCHAAARYLGVTGIKSLNHYEAYAGQPDCVASGCHLSTGGRSAQTNYTRWTN